MNIKQKRIFFVDDDLQVCEAVSEILKESGFEVCVFNSASDCLKKMHSHKCDLLITDLRMPEIDGIEFIHKVKSFAPWIPVIILTGYGNIPTAVSTVKAGVVDFIEKPIDKDSFLRRITSILQAGGSGYEYVDKLLTRSEKRVLRLVLEGKGSKEIAFILKRSKRTIDAHRYNIMRKLGVSNLVGLYKYAVTMQLVEIPKKEKSINPTKVP